MSTPALALNNLRTFAIVIVLAVHSFVAYLASSPATSFRFDDPPFRWRSIPIIDGERWLGFDIFCAHQDTYLIALLFFLSGLFVWPSLARKGARNFLRDRAVRLGLPFVLAVGLLMPVAHYPIYRVTAADPSVTAYWRHLLALPFWPSGPPWFLWVLLVFDLGAAALYAFARRSAEAFIQVVGKLSARPAALVTVLVAASGLAYVPLALAFTPWTWFHVGPFAFQLCRPLLYAVYFLTGVGVGAHGIERGVFLAPGGWLTRHWTAAAAAAIATFALWLGLVGIAMSGNRPPSLQLQVLEASGFVLCCAAGSIFMLAVFVRFASRHIRILDAFSEETYGMYLVHYLFSVWLQFALLGFAVLAIIKAAIVFSATLLLSWGSVAATRRALNAVRIVAPVRWSPAAPRLRARTYPAHLREGGEMATRALGKRLQSKRGV
jgi:Acyltransferase family